MLVLKFPNTKLLNSYHNRKNHISHKIALSKKDPLFYIQRASVNIIFISSFFTLFPTSFPWLATNNWPLTNPFPLSSFPLFLLLLYPFICCSFLSFLPRFFIFFPLSVSFPSFLHPSFLPSLLHSLPFLLCYLFLLSFFPLFLPSSRSLFLSPIILFFLYLTANSSNIEQMLCDSHYVKI